MGLFKKKPEKKPEKTPAQSAADYAKQRGDFISYFALAHKDEIEVWDNLIMKSRQRMSMPLSVEQKLSALDESRNLICGFRDWCAAREYGEQYFQFSYNQHERSMLKRVEEEIGICKTLLYSVIPKIMACDGELQSALVKSLSADYHIEENAIRAQIYQLEKDGLIRREKHGNSYLIFKA